MISEQSVVGKSDWSRAPRRSGVLGSHFEIVQQNTGGGSKKLIFGNVRGPVNKGRRQLCEKHLFEVSVFETIFKSK